MSTTDNESVDLRIVTRHLWSRKWWLLASILLFTGLAAAAAFLLTPKYRAVAVLVTATQDKGGSGLLGAALGQLGGLGSIAGLGGAGGDSQSQEAVAVLESRQFTESFISDHDLLPVLFSGRWDAGAKRWRGAQEDWPTLADGFRYFHNRVRSVAKNKETGLVTLTIEWRDPVQSAAWANMLVDRLNAEMRARAIERASSSLAYLEKELSGTLIVETRQAISRLVEAQINQRMLANVTREYVFRFVDRALPPDRDDEVWPPKLLFLFGGILLGALAGVGGVLLARAIRGYDASPQ